MKTSRSRKEQVREFIVEVLAKGRGATASIADTDNLIESGVVDSLGITRLVHYLETTFSIKIPDEHIVPENFESVAAIQQYLANNPSKANAACADE
jgi:acyl carrier protein